MSSGRRSEFLQFGSVMDGARFFGGRGARDLGAVSSARRGYDVNVRVDIRAISRVRRGASGAGRILPLEAARRVRRRGE